MDYDFNPDLSQAQTIPSTWYQGPESLLREQEKIFSRSWIFVGRSEQVAKAGDYFTTRIGEENLVIVRDTENTLRAFFNVCRHRAGPLAKGAGNSRSLRCHYHGWTYGLDGSLQSVPEFQGVQNFDVKNCKLPRVQVRVWGPLVFAAIHPSMSFEEFVGTAPDDLKNCHLEGMKFFTSKDYLVHANWMSIITWKATTFPRCTLLFAVNSIIKIIAWILSAGTRLKMLPREKLQNSMQGAIDPAPIITGCSPI